MPDCLPLNCEKNKSKHSSENSRKDKIKTTHSPAKTPSKAVSNSISTAESDTPEVIEVPKKRATQSTQSLVTLGRAYGNNISKQYIHKASSRHQSTQDIREPWHTSSKTESREYGDYFSWQTGLSFLETHRISIINSKGIQHFVDEYMKKLQRCQIFERGHNVEPFASVRHDLLNNVYGGKNSRTSVVCESVENVGSYKSYDSIHKNKNALDAKTKNLSDAALKTIELLRKLKHGKSIEADLQMSKISGLGVNKNSTSELVTRSGSIANSSQNYSMQNKKRLTKQSYSDANSSLQRVFRSGSTANSNQNFSMQNQKQLTKESYSDTRTSDRAKTKEIEQQLRNLDEKSIESITPSYGTNQDLLKNLQLSEQKANISQISNSLNSQSSFLLQKKSLASENDRVNRYFSSKRSVESRVSGFKENVNSIESLYRSEGSLKDENIAPNSTVSRRKSK